MSLRPVEHLLAIAWATPPEPPMSNQTTMRRHRDPLDAIAERYGVPRDRLVALYPDPSRLIRVAGESIARRLREDFDAEARRLNLR